MESKLVPLLKLIKDNAPLKKMTPTLESLLDRGELLSTLTEQGDGGKTPLHHAQKAATLKVVSTPT